MTYALLNSGVDYKKLQSKIKNVFSGFIGYDLEELQLCPMKNIYINFNGRNDYVIVLFLYGSIGIFILLMSSFNYINLTIANSSIRGKEIALKKVCGGNRFSLILQFLRETILISSIALILAFEFVRAFLPVYSDIIGKPLNISLMGNHGFIGFTILISVVVGLISGIYPALFLSSQNILTLFKRELFVKGPKKISLKHALVTFQFSISVFLILLTLLFWLQLRYLSQKNLGFNKENILYTTISISNQEITFDQLRNRILQHPEIKNASMSKNLPFVKLGGGRTNWEGGDPKEQVTCRFNTVSYDFIKNLFVIILLTTSYQTLKAATRNPVEALRYE